MCPHPVRVPQTVQVKELEVQVMVPTGPWAGDLSATKPLPILHEKK
jgi:hypothetical protein